MEMMKGILKENAEKGAKFRTDLPIPEVGPRDILVRVKAAAICGTDQHIYNWTQYAQERVPVPMVFGHEFAGEVVKVGAEHTPGAFADYISFPVDCAYKINDELDYNTAAMMEPMGVGVHGVDKGDVAGKDVVIYGCGPIGLMAIGAARCMEAKTITAIDVFDNKLEVAKKMGADYVINSKEEDAVKLVLERTKHGCDVVIDYTGSPVVIKSGFGMLRKGGRFVLVGLSNGETSLDLSEDIIYKEATVIGVTGREMYRTWEQCEAILKDPRYNAAATIGGVYKLEDYEEAFKDIFSGKPGKMLLIP